MQYDLLLKRPKLTILIFTIITFFISIQAVNMKITSDIEVYMPEKQPSVVLLNKIRQEWPIDSLMIYVESDNITSIASLKEMDGVESALNPYEGMEDQVMYTASIASLIKETNAKIPIGKDEIPNNQIYVNALLKLIPEEIKEKLVSEDNKNGVIILTTSKDANVDVLLDENVYPIVKTTKKIKAFPTGMLTLYKETIDWIMERINSIALLSLVLILLILFAFHRDMKTVIIAIAPVLYSIALTFGTMGMMNIEFAPTVIAVLPLLGALGVAYSLHMINYFMELIGYKPKNAVKKVINTTGKAVFLSAITTIVGFASLLTSEMPPISNMGLAFFIGVLYCFISTMILIPCLLLAFPPRKRVAIEWKSLSNLTRYRKQILLLLAMVCLVSISSIPQVSTRTSVWEMMPLKMESNVIMHEYSKKFEAGQSGVILVETNKKEGMLEPKLLEKLDNMEKILNTGIENVSVYSIVDAIKSINFGRLPKTKEEVRKVIDKMPEKYKIMMLDDELSKTLIYVEMPIMPLEETKRSVSSINQIIEQYNKNEYGKISKLTGLAAITVELNAMLMSQQFRFMFISLILVFICLLLVFRSFKYAIFTIIPIILLLILEPSILVLLKIPLNVSTITVSSIAIGVGIDFAVHITERVREEIKTKSGLKSIKIALSRKSPSLAEATIALIGGGVPIFLMEYEMISQFIMLVLFMLAFACIISILSLASIYSAKNGKLLEGWK